ncbi:MULTISPECIES: hypothetical protein [unclassified Rhizobium]|uniref:hypothetical protein n=1 Tax=unclassified Rhizobium TaxID=2613769 RepID=UPI001FDEB728|nr:MULTISPECIES: hypothetical protein [unclassified Rhizobium]MDF0662145.1 hypothetical protein [Rhizobium sp. BC49]
MTFVKGARCDADGAIGRERPRVDANRLAFGSRSRNDRTALLADGAPQLTVASEEPSRWLPPLRSITSAGAGKTLLMGPFHQGEHVWRILIDTSAQNENHLFESAEPDVGRKMEHQQASSLQPRNEQIDYRAAEQDCQRNSVAGREAGI